MFFLFFFKKTYKAYPFFSAKIGVAYQSQIIIWLYSEDTHLTNISINNNASANVCVLEKKQWKHIWIIVWVEIKIPLNINSLSLNMERRAEIIPMKTN